VAISVSLFFIIWVIDSLTLFSNTIVIWPIEGSRRLWMLRVLSGPVRCWLLRHRAILQYDSFNQNTTHRDPAHAAVPRGLKPVNVLIVVLIHYDSSCIATRHHSVAMDGPPMRHVTPGQALRFRHRVVSNRIEVDGSRPSVGPRQFEFDTAIF